MIKLNRTFQKFKSPSKIIDITGTIRKCNGVLGIFFLVERQTALPLVDGNAASRTAVTEITV